MPRPQKDGIDYFPMDVNFFSDPKIKILKARYGVDGVAVYIYLLCEIYRAGYYIRYTEDSAYIMSDDLNMSSDKVMQVLKFLLERSLFDNILFQSDDVLTSAGIQKRFQLAVKERAKKNPIIIKGFWVLSEEETEPFIKVNSFLNRSGKNEDNSGKNEDNSPEESPKESKGKKSKGNKTIGAVTYVPDDRLNQALIDFAEYRKRIKRPLTDRAVELLIENLAKLSADPTDQIEILNQSIVNGWQGVFPLKNKMATQKGQAKPAPNRFHNFDQRDTDYDSLMMDQARAWIGEGEKDGNQ